jgi:4-amino-4-deoxy-L-arabinose transferase-like glycosyltransferase
MLSFSSITTTLKHTTWQQKIFGLLVIAAIVLRFYNLKGGLLFLGDQGRDALIVSRIFTQKDIVFIGPVTSVGNMYLGPMYYYFMLPFLWLTYPSPMGPVYAVALLGVITVALMYVIGKKLIGETAALWATFFYALSATTIQYSRFSWNPNPAPFVSLVMMYFSYLAWKKHPWYWIGVALCAAVLMQLHYITLLSIGGAGIVWLISAYERWQHSKHRFQKIQQLVVPTLIGVGLFLLTLTPLVLFDAKHDWLNAKAFQTLFTKEQSFKVSNEIPLSIKAIHTLEETHGRSLHILFEYVFGKYRTTNTILVLLFSSIIIWHLLKKKHGPYWSGLVVVVAYLATGIFGTAIYDHTIFDHYIAYLFPCTFLVYGFVVNQFWQKNWGKVLVAGFSMAFLALNVPRWPYHSVSWTIDDMHKVAQTIRAQIKPEDKYTIVLLSESKDLYAQNYRYFLWSTDHPPLDPERAGEANTLVVINEEKKAENVAALPIYEIVTFPEKSSPVVYTIPGGPEIIIFRKTAANP